jgi:hypothetical protein
MPIVGPEPALALGLGRLDYVDLRIPQRSGAGPTLPLVCCARLIRSRLAVIAPPAVSSDHAAHLIRKQLIIDSDSRFIPI